MKINFIDFSLIAEFVREAFYIIYIYKTAKSLSHAVAVGGDRRKVRVFRRRHVRPDADSHLRAAQEPQEHDPQPVGVERLRHRLGRTRIRPEGQVSRRRRTGLGPELFVPVERSE